MVIEKISKIEILENGGLCVVLESGGSPLYQYVYREAAEVCWDSEKSAFRAPAPRAWDQSDWFQHIVNVVAAGLGVTLVLSAATIWVNVPVPLMTLILTKKV